MLLRSRGNNTLRLFERRHGSELRFNRQIFFANADLTRMIKIVLENADGREHPASSITEHDIDIVQIRCVLEKLSTAGIPLSFWGEVWCEENTDL